MERTFPNIHIPVVETTELHHNREIFYNT